MTGRDLILCVLANGLEDEPILKDGKLIGFITVEEAAVKFDVGESTVRAWFNLGAIDGIEIGGMLYILMTAQRPIRVYGDYGEFCGLQKMQ